MLRLLFLAALVALSLAVKSDSFPKEMPFPDVLRPTRGAEGAWKSILPYIAGKTNLPESMVDFEINFTLKQWKELHQYPASVENMMRLTLKDAILAYAITPTPTPVPVPAPKSTIDWCTRKISNWYPCAAETQAAADAQCVLDQPHRSQSVSKIENLSTIFNAYRTCEARWYKDAPFTLLTVMDALRISPVQYTIVTILVSILFSVRRSVIAFMFPPKVIYVN